MATDVQHGSREEHWTAKGGVMAVALAAGLLVPVLGLAIVVPCLVSARRAGVKTTPYVLALVLCVASILLFAISILAQSLIEPS
jgi:hypothetical protein